MPRKRSQPRASTDAEPLPPSPTADLEASILARRMSELASEAASKASESITTREDGTVETYANFRELLRGGFRPVILELHSQGLNAGEIAKTLSEDFNVTVHPQSVTAAINRLGPLEGVQIAAARRGHAELHQAALEQMYEMRADYKALKDAPLSAEKDAARNRNTRMEMLQRYYIQWWDRVGKFHFKADSVSLTANITQVSLVDALDKVKGKPTQAAAVLAELRGETDGE